MFLDWRLHGPVAYKFKVRKGKVER